MKKVMILVVLFWACLIVWFSSQTVQSSTSQTYKVLEKLNMATETELIQSNSDDIRALKYITRKGAHFLLFFVLGSMLASGLFVVLQLTGRLLTNWSWGLGTAFGIADEIHQYFVPGRAMQVKDMIIDSMGVLFGVLLTVWILELLLKAVQDWKCSRCEGLVDQQLELE